MVGGTQLLLGTHFSHTPRRQHVDAMEHRTTLGCNVWCSRFPRFMGHLRVVLLGCISMVGSAPGRDASEQRGTQVEQAGSREAKVVRSQRRCGRRRQVWRFHWRLGRRFWHVRSRDVLRSKLADVYLPTPDTPSHVGICRCACGVESLLSG